MNRSYVRWALVVALGAGAAIAADRADAAPEKSKVVAKKQSVGAFDADKALVLRSDVIGVLSRDELDERGAKELADQLGLKLSSRESERIFTFSLGQQQERAGLVKLARAIRKKGIKQIAQVGMVFGIKGKEQELKIVSDELIVELPRTSRERVDGFANMVKAQVITKNPFVKNQFLLALDEDSPFDAIEAAKLIAQEGARFAHPNYVNKPRARETIPGDALFAEQWHHRNTGGALGAVDADVDTSHAWDLTATASARPLVAVIEPGGMVLNHPDYEDNVAPGTWDFSACDASPVAGCGDAMPGEARHGTAVAGTVAAEADGTRGVVGSCPTCRLLMLQVGNTDFSEVLTFDYARTQGADILTNSWGYAGVSTAVQDAIARAAVNGRGGLGSPVLFAMNTTGGGYFEDCTGPSPDISAQAEVIAVAASNHHDQRTPSGYGDCMEIVAPTDASDTTLGTLAALTTDRVGTAGYNNASPVIPGCVEGPNRDYTHCFGGTSFATPLVAGVVGLALQGDSTLSRDAIVRMLQDSADKIDPTFAAYDTNTGFSRPSTPPSTGMPVGSIHGYGRANALEAVRLVAPVSVRGRGNVDLFMRDNRLDWGNTEQPSNFLFEPARGHIGHWQSVDIKVDAEPFEAAPPTAANFDSYPDEPARAGLQNRAYVRVRNRGRLDATGVSVRLFLTFAGTALPALPPTFWTDYLTGVSSPTWNSVPPVGAADGLTVPYSGASVAGTAADAAQIVGFEFLGPTVDPSVPSSEHFCLLATATSPSDDISPATMGSLNVDYLNPRDNNVTQRNIRVVPGGRFFGDRILASNPTDRGIWTQLSIEAPKGWEVWYKDPVFAQPFYLKPGEQRVVDIQVGKPEKTAGDVHVLQTLVEPKRIKGVDRVLGGFTFRFTE